LPPSTAFERRRYARDRDPGPNCTKAAGQVCPLREKTPTPGKDSADSRADPPSSSRLHDRRRRSGAKSACPAGRFRRSCCQTAGHLGNVGLNTLIKGDCDDKPERNSIYCRCADGGLDICNSRRHEKTHRNRKCTGQSRSKMDTNNRLINTDTLGATSRSGRFL